MQNNDHQTSQPKVLRVLRCRSMKLSRPSWFFRLKRGFSTLLNAFHRCMNLFRHRCIPYRLLLRHRTSRHRTCQRVRVRILPLDPVKLCHPNGRRALDYPGQAFPSIHRVFPMVPVHKACKGRISDVPLAVNLAVNLFLKPRMRTVQDAQHPTHLFKALSTRASHRALWHHSMNRVTLSHIRVHLPCLACLGTRIRPYRVLARIRCQRLRPARCSLQHRCRHDRFRQRAPLVNRVRLPRPQRSDRRPQGLSRPRSLRR